LTIRTGPDISTVIEIKEVTMTKGVGRFAETAPTPRSPNPGLCCLKQAGNIPTEMPRHDYPRRGRPI
jgi:hypothetical protein